MAEKVSDYVFRYLHDAVGVKVCFMLPGGGCMHLVDSLGKSKIRYICNLHEQASAIAADAAGQYTGNLGLALVTAGPGSTNALTGVAGSWIDSTPVLILSGQAKHNELMEKRGMRQMGIQEVDTPAIMAPVTKYAVTVKDPARIPYELEKAVYLARTPRKGPVWVDIPVDVQGALIEPEKLEHFSPPAPPDDAEEYRKAAEFILAELAKAKRPAIYVGNGVRATDHVKQFLRFAEKFGVPVLTSWKAADFIRDDHPLFAGRPGIIASRGANVIQQTADFLLLLGTRLDLCQTGFNHPGFAPRARKVIVDIDRPEIDKLNMEFVGKFALDAGRLIDALLDAPAEPEPRRYARWAGFAREMMKRYPIVTEEMKHGEKINLYHFVDELSELLRDDDLLIPGSSGACAEFVMQAIRIKSAARIFNTPGLGSMGFGLPAAIGGAVVSGRRTIGIVGDGGLQHNIQELQTLKNLALPIKFFVLNNGGYISIVNMQKARFNSHFVASNAESGLHLPDLSRLVPAYGLEYRKLASPEELRSRLAELLELPGTVVVEVMTDPEAVCAPRLSSQMLPDGRMVPMPMENLAPFLPEPELKELLNWS